MTEGLKDVTLKSLQDHASRVVDEFKKAHGLFFLSTEISRDLHARTDPAD